MLTIKTLFMNLINIRNLTKIYHTTTKEIKALENISIDIEDNKITSIIGPSGCGKSTLLNLITKIESTSTGTIRNNKDLIIGYMMQTDALLPWMSVFDNAMLGLKLQKNINDETKCYVINLLKKYDLYDFKDEYPNNLSGGMRQRLALIRTLAIKPNILLLDEPFSKLDVETRKNITDDVYKIIKELNITTILITHDIEEAISLSDNIIILSKRPGSVKCAYKLNYDKVTLPSERRKEGFFSKLYENIWSNIDHD